jgi:ribosome recycling factor
MIDDMLHKAEQKMQQAVEAAGHDFQRLRTGRANPQMLERVMVDYYGTPTPINQVANISVPEPRQLLVTPYDKSATPNIERAILKSDLGINPITDGSGIRLNVPAMTEERRKDMVKQLHARAEEGCVGVRNIRRDAHNHMKQSEKNHEVSEDDLKRAEQKLQKLTDQYVEQIHDIQKAKEEELMEV